MTSLFAGFYENWGFSGRTCEACPAQSTSAPGRAYAASDCMCDKGSYMQNVGSVYTCALCEDRRKPMQGCDCNGYYGSRGSSCAVCPDNSNAAAGATALSDCKCLSGYYQKGSDSNFTCLECPPFSVPFYSEDDKWMCNCTVAMILSSCAC